MPGGGRLKIFTIKLEYFLDMEKNVSALEWPSLITKNGKVVCWQKLKVWYDRHG